MAKKSKTIVAIFTTTAAALGLVVLVIVNSWYQVRQAAAFFYQACLEAFKVFYSSGWVGYIGLAVGLVLFAGLCQGIWFVLRQIYFYNKFYRNRYFIGRQTVIGGTSVFVIDDNRQFAFSAGFIKPQIYLSAGLIDILDKEELQAVISHEQYHCDNFHSIWSLFSGFVKKVLFFVPIVVKWVDFISIRREVKADEYTIDQVGAENLSSSLLKVLKAQHKVDYGFEAQAFSSLASRIEFILYRRHHSFRIPLKFVFVSAVVILLTIVGIGQAWTRSAFQPVSTTPQNSSACHDQTSGGYFDYLDTAMPHNMSYLLD